MQLSEKLKILRNLEGSLRGLNRPLSKSEIVRLISEELNESISQAYLSQLESGKRPHMTEKTRELLSRFFKVHPGYFVSDPEGFNTALTTVQLDEDKLDAWLLSGADQFSTEDPELAVALRILAGHNTTRELLMLLAELVRSPDQLRRLGEAVRAAAASGHAPATRTRTTRRQAK